MALGFLKKGAAAHKAFDKQEAEVEAKKVAGSGPRRYWMPEGKENQITFLDGDLDDSGLLESVAYWEHNLKLNGHWRNWYTCTQTEEPCPICEGGADPALVSAFTVIDHSEYVDSNKVTHKNELRLFICKRETFRRLQKIATKRGGLKGCTFDVSRTGDKSPNVGDSFDFVEKQSLAAIEKQYGLKKGSAVPFDYDEVIKYIPAKELRKLGFGSTGPGVGGDDDDDDADAAAMAGKSKGKSKVVDYSDDV